MRTNRPYPKFTVYKHRFIIKDNLIVTRQFIVLNHEDGTLQFTNFHKYVPSPLNPVRSITSDGNSRFYFVVKFLNYAFFDVGIDRLNHISVEIVRDFFQLYGMCDLPDDTDSTTRKKTTVERCITSVIDFLFNLMGEQKGLCNLKRYDLYKKKSYRDKHGVVHEKNVPAFEVNYIDDYDNPIFRDMPDKAFNIIFTHILTVRKDLLGLVLNSAFAGLRPSEACNVRRPDSPLGPGIIFEEIDGIVRSIQIDLRHELNLRSDLKLVGRIKKERLQTIPEIFVSAYVEAYKTYLKYLKGKKYETAYAPLNVNSRGMAYTYPLYYHYFKEMIEQDIIPLFLSNADPELQIYGRILQEHSISPHIFRHWFTVQLVLSGISDPYTIMYYRGDTNKDSAETYLKNKSELEHKYQKVNDRMFDYMMWRSKKQHD